MTGPVVAGGLLAAALLVGCSGAGGHAVGAGRVAPSDSGPGTVTVYGGRDTQDTVPKHVPTRPTPVPTLFSALAPVSSAPQQPTASPAPATQAATQGGAAQGGSSSDGRPWWQSTIPNGPPPGSTWKPTHVSANPSPYETIQPPPTSGTSSGVPPVRVTVVAPSSAAPSRSASAGS
jgi:hypothetical protein